MTLTPTRVSFARGASGCANDSGFLRTGRTDRTLLVRRQRAELSEPSLSRSCGTRIEAQAPSGIPSEGLIFGVINVCEGYRLRAPRPSQHLLPRDFLRLDEAIADPLGDVADPASVDSVTRDEDHGDTEMI